MTPSGIEPATENVKQHGKVKGVVVPVSARKEYEEWEVHCLAPAFFIY